MWRHRHLQRRATMFRAPEIGVSRRRCSTHCPTIQLPLRRWRTSSGGNGGPSRFMSRSGLSGICGLRSNSGKVRDRPLDCREGASPRPRPTRSSDSRWCISWRTCRRAPAARCAFRQFLRCLRADWRPTVGRLCPPAGRLKCWVSCQPEKERMVCLPLSRASRAPRFLRFWRARCGHARAPRYLLVALSLTGGGVR